MEMTSAGPLSFFLWIWKVGRAIMQIRERLRKREVRRILWSYVFLTPQLVIYLTLTIVPIFVAIPVLFTDKLNFTDRDWDYVGVTNFVELVEDPGLRETYTGALGRTARFTVLNYVMVYVFGLCLALLMYEPS
jgi:ABC-type sugar transport system permease subunit